MADFYESSVRYHLGPIRHLLEDERVSEILINGPHRVFAEIGGRLALQSKVRFAGPDELYAAAVNIAQYSGHRVDEHTLSFDGSLPDGSRVHVVLPPVVDGVHVAIRKFSDTTLGMAELIEFGALSREAARLLKAAVLCNKTVVVSGGTSSGKTTLLAVLVGFLPDTDRIVVIEDTPEIQVTKPHVVHLVTAAPDNQGRGGMGLRELLATTLRLRPDRILVGEVRGPEALDLLNALNSGHGGTMTSLHASSPSQALAKLETLCLFAGEDVPARALRSTIAGAIDVVVQCERLRDGTRRVTRISEVHAGLDDHGDYRLQDLFVLEQGGLDAYGNVIGRLSGCGVLPTFFRDAEQRGLGLKAAHFGVVQS